MSHDDVSQRDEPRDSGAVGDDRAMDEILDGGRRPETEDEMTLHRLLSALRAPGTADELRGLEATTAAFVNARAEVAAGPAAVGATARRPLAAAGVAVAAVLASVTFVGAAAAAYTGSLPSGAQEWAHEHIGAPSARAVESTEAHDDATPSSSSAHGSGPAVSPSDPAVLGQCIAYTHRASGVALDDVALRNLLAVAQAAGKSADAYCADILATASHRPTDAASPSHKPTATPAATPTPSRRPTTPAANPSPSNKPTAKPSPSGTRQSSPAIPRDASKVRTASAGSGR